MGAEMQIVGFSDPADRARLSPSAIRGFAKMMAIWGVDEQDAAHLLGGIPLATYFELKSNPDQANFDEETMIRISLLLGIFKAINILHGQELADQWISLPNTGPIFQGITPLGYLLREGIPGMYKVRRELDARLS
jgi:uncharacterized protein (DUF2384 family)